MPCDGRGSRTWKSWFPPRIPDSALRRGALKERLRRLPRLPLLRLAFLRLPLFPRLPGGLPRWSLAPTLLLFLACGPALSPAFGKVSQGAALSPGKPAPGTPDSAPEPADPAPASLLALGLFRERDADLDLVFRYAQPLNFLRSRDEVDKKQPSSWQAAPFLFSSLLQGAGARAFISEAGIEVRRLWLDERARDAVYNSEYLGLGLSAYRAEVNRPPHLTGTAWRPFLFVSGGKYWKPFRNLPLGADLSLALGRVVSGRLKEEPGEEHFQSTELRLGLQVFHPL